MLNKGAKSFTSSIARLNTNHLKDTLDRLGKQHYYRLQSSRQKSSVTGNTISFIPLETDIKETNGLLMIKDKIQSNSKQIIDPEDAITRYFTGGSTQKKNSFNSLIIGSLDDIEIRYGEEGVMAKKNESLDDILSNSLFIKKCQTGILDIKTQVPFQIKSSRESFIISLEETKIFPSYEENLKRSSMYIINKNSPFDKIISKAITSKISDTILGNPNNQSFGDGLETSLIIDKADYDNKSTTHAMVFDGRSGSDGSASTHYHYGERVLIILTTDKDAGVKVNTCGIKEEPENRKDLEVEYKFKPNSITLLKFPSLAWHKFSGDFVCFSLHTVEIDELIDRMNKGENIEKFLEENTVFSKQRDNKWNNFGLSLQTENLEVLR